MRGQCAQISVDFRRSNVAFRRWALIGAILSVVLCGSNPARAQNGPPMGNPPVIQNFVAINRGGGVWELRGQVMDEQPAGLTVYFGGVIGGSAVTWIDGTFSYVFSLPRMVAGTVYACVMDGEGLMGGAQTYIFNY
jgi:hypothetical protein